MSMLTSLADELRDAAKLYDHMVEPRTASLMREAADTILRLREMAQADRCAELDRKVADLEGMLGELPPEGKCAMLLVQHVDGEYVWACEKYDFASYRIVDVEADSCTGMTLNDPFGRADSGDKLTMAKMLRESAAELEGQGDALGVIDMQRERIAELEAEVERWRGRAEMLEGYIEGPQGWRASCEAYEALVRDLWKGHDCGAGCAMFDGCHHLIDDRCPMEERMASLGIGVER